jgi:hypothetical protein
VAGGAAVQEPGRGGASVGASTSAGCHVARDPIRPRFGAGAVREPGRTGGRTLKGTKTSDRDRDQVFRRVARPASPPRPRCGIWTVHWARHLFREHCRATPDPMAHLRTAGGSVEDPAMGAVAKVLHFRRA